MTLLRVRGVNRVTAKGHVYFYHRATGTRLRADPARQPAAFAAEVRALDRGAPAAQPAPLPGSVGGLIVRYRGSPEFLGLKPTTQTSYQRVFDAVRRLDSLDLEQVDQPFLLGLRDTIYRRSGRWLANYAMSVLSVLFAWGMPRGIVATNPAAGVPKIRRPKGTGVANKAWKPGEIEQAIKEAKRRGHVGLAKAMALAYYGGLRKQDVVKVPCTARKGGEIDIESISKTDTALAIFEARRLRTVLNWPDRTSGETLVVRADGQPYTPDGLDSLFHRLKTDMVADGKLRAGLTFHGLRKSLLKKGADLGFSEDDLAGAAGNKSTQSVRPYTVEANRRKGARRVFKALERRR